MFRSASSLIIIIISALSFSVILHALPTAASNPPIVVTAASPAGERSEARTQIEQAILSATVRMQVESWQVYEDESGYDRQATISHATLIDDRYLVTHNHFNMPLRAEAQPDAYTMVTLFNIRGEQLFRGPLAEFIVVSEELETVVLTHQDPGLFNRLGFRSIPVGTTGNAGVQPGTALAQLNWDGENTFIQWVTVERVESRNGTAAVVLSDHIKKGASGGGLFLDGTHIGNNWRNDLEHAPEGHRFLLSVVALNSTELAVSPAD